MPRLISVAGLIFSIALLVKEILARRGQRVTGSSLPHLHTAATTFVWMAGFLTLVYLGGYLLAAMIFVPAFLLIVARASTKVTIIYTAVALVVLLALPSRAGGPARGSAHPVRRLTRYPNPPLVKGVVMTRPHLLIVANDSDFGRRALHVGEEIALEKGWDVAILPPRPTATAPPRKTCPSTRPSSRPQEHTSPSSPRPRPSTTPATRPSPSPRTRSPTSSCSASAAGHGWASSSWAAWQEDPAEVDCPVLVSRHQHSTRKHHRVRRDCLRFTRLG